MPASALLEVLSAKHCAEIGLESLPCLRGRASSVEEMRVDVEGGRGVGVPELAQHEPTSCPWEIRIDANVRRGASKVTLSGPLRSGLIEATRSGPGASSNPWPSRYSSCLATMTAPSDCHRATAEASSVLSPCLAPRAPDRRMVTPQTSIPKPNTRHRGGGIRTHDPLLPKQVRYQAAPRPVQLRVVVPEASALRTSADSVPGGHG
jgi:hypothetical protein